MSAGDRLRALIEGLAGARDRRSPRTERALLAVAAVLFVGVTAVSLANLPPVEGETHWWLLAPVAVLALVGTAINGGEVWVGARIHGIRVGALDAFSASALSSAANLLPVPGAVLVKVRALRQHGLSTGGAVRATAGLGVIWVGLGLVVAGGLQIGSDHGRPLLGLAVTVGGAAATAAGVAMLGAASATRRLEAVGLELASVLCTTLRLWLVLAALGRGDGVAAAAALAAAGIVASAAGLFPGGLGLRELLSGATAGLVGLDPSVGVVVAAVDRLVSLAVLALLSLVLTATGERGPTTTSGAAPCES